MSIVKGYQTIARLAEFGEWEGVTSPELDIATDNYFPPGARTPLKLPSTGSFTDITLTRAYDPANDNKVEAWVMRYLNGLETPRNLTIVVLNDQNIVQATKTYVVKPTGYKAPDGKSGDANISEFTLKLACEARL
jgi:hypothetical protein